MCSEPIEQIVIVGGGTAGWMTAAALSHLLPERCSIELVESEQIGTVGVGEATIPHIRQFNALLGIDEGEFIEATQATYKLAIKFEGWGAKQNSYLHPFSAFGFELNGIDFHHYWLKAKSLLSGASLDSFSIASQAALDGKFAPATPDHEPGFGYAFHLDASLYAKYLRRYAQQRGVRRIEGKVQSVRCHRETGEIESVSLVSGQQVSGQLFIDCSGFRALLIGEALGVGYNDWRHWLTCDRAVAMASPAMPEPPSYTNVTATETGWQWRIPLQHRTGNGQVYSSEYLSDEAAAEQLRVAIGAPPLTDPNFIRFTPGYRHKSWEKNCIALGLSSGFLEPLESTSIYLIHRAILKLVEYFPTRGCPGKGPAAFNRWMSMEYQRVRDFLILHYHLNAREEPFWRAQRELQIPSELEEKIALFNESGRLEHYRYGLFAEPSWLAVFLGQGMLPHHVDPRLNKVPAQQIARQLERMAKHCRAHVANMPSHRSAINSRPRADAATASLSLYGSRYA